MWKLVAGFKRYGLIRLFGPSGINLVSWPQTPKLQNVFRFHDFI